MTIEEQLRAAWTRIRRQAWPDTYEECMTVPLIAAQISCEACRRRNYRPPEPRMRKPLPQPRPVAVDIKRRASGEKDNE